ncbi:protein FAM180A [Ctenopharyngodon idella]|uniref:protein FAM180A n=1 Tax=Ctenopharyngodon idella TaxID=7959 RepID=UPI00222EFE8F|nr:protein FAM180A [Ctenopharyngodon idella]
MTAIRILSVSALMCQMSITASLHWRKALYPSAFRVKRGTPALLNPSFQKSVEDANLLYEVLLSGAYMDAARGTLHISDQELASMRKLEILEVLCEDVLPRSLSEIQRLGAQLALRRGSLRMEDFERTVLTMVFTAQQLQHTNPGHQRELWANSLIPLYKAIKEDLRPVS